LSEKNTKEKKDTIAHNYTLKSFLMRAHAIRIRVTLN